MPDPADTTKKWRQNFIERIIQARTEQKMTQAQLAQMVGTQRSNISRLESGTHNPSLDFLLNVANALSLELDLIPRVREDWKATENLYELRLYDRALLEFKLEERGVSLAVEITEILSRDPHLFPLDLRLTDEGVLSWLRHRVIPKNRAFVEEILKTLGLSVGNTKGIIDVCKGLSLNDSFWVVPRGFPGRFSQYNLYENEFSEILSRVAYTGIARSNPAFTTSPELTTGGMLPKAWHRVAEGDIYLYKGGTSGAANTGNEPYSEFYACQIAQAMGLNAIFYDLEYWKDILASKCKLFTDIDTAFIAIGQLVPTGGLQACLDYYAALGDDFSEALHSMLVFDAVIYNEDRHFGNFGILRDNLSGAIISPAPIYDNGLSLFNYAMPDDILHLDEYAKTRFPAYGDISFERICSEVMGKLQAEQLRGLIGFKFRRHPSINLPEARLQAIEKHIQRRVRQLLGL